MTPALLYILLAGLTAPGVETHGEPHARGDNGRSFGMLQIKQCVVDDVNRLEGTHYTHEDCDNPLIASEMLAVYELHYATPERLGHKPTLEDAARIWNGGPNGWKKPCTLAYWAKVHAALTTR